MYSPKVWQDLRFRVLKEGDEFGSPGLMYGFLKKLYPNVENHMASKWNNEAGITRAV